MLVDHPRPALAGGIGVTGADLLREEHGQLYEFHGRLVRHLRGFRGRLQPLGDTSYQQHYDFAESATGFSTYLDGAIRLAESTLYPASFAVLRSALEQQALDTLYFLANRFAVTQVGIDDDELADLQGRLARGELPADVVSIERLRGTKIIVTRTGMHLAGEGRGPEAPTISRLFAVLEHYDPFAGRASSQEWLVGDFFGTVGERAERARRNAATWRDNLRWESLRRNLELNGFYTPAELARWDVHYSFLSAFTHPTPRAFRAVWGRDQPSHPRYDHYCSELALLYSVTLARLELEALESMAAREPVVGLTGWPDVRRDMDAARAFTAYLWFPRGDPTEFDGVEEANRRGPRFQDSQMVWPETRPRPEELSPNEIRY